MLIVAKNNVCAFDEVIKYACRDRLTGHGLHVIIRLIRLDD